MSFVSKGLQKLDAQPYAPADRHSLSPSDRPHSEEDQLHMILTQQWTAVSDHKRSATPPSHFSDPQTRELLGESSISVSIRSAAGQDSDGLGIYSESDMDPSEAQQSHKLHQSIVAAEQRSAEIAESESQDDVDEDAATSFSHFLADNISSSHAEATTNAKNTEQPTEDDTPLVQSRQFKKAQKRKSSESYENDSNIDERPIRVLRDRTLRQEMPFRMDRVEHNLARKGVKKTESDLEEELDEQIHAKKKARKAISKGFRMSKKKARRPLTEGKNLPSPTPTPPAINDTYEERGPEPDIFQTTVRTRLKGFGKGHLPIALPSSKSTAALFDLVRQKWRRGLNGRDIHHCIISFPWLATLGEDEDIVMFGESDNDVYNCMLEKIRRAPTWTKVERCEIDILIYPDENGMMDADSETKEKVAGTKS